MDAVVAPLVDADDRAQLRQPLASELAGRRARQLGTGRVNRVEVVAAAMSA